MDKTKNLFLTTVFLIVAIFIIGVLIGRWMGNAGVNEIESFIKNNELDTESYLIEQELIQNFEKESCDLANARISSLGNDLWKIGQRLSPEDAEEKLGKENFHFLKQKYHLLQIRTYILLYTLKQNCNETSSVILFYYSKDDESSLEQGEILDTLVEEKGIQVFAIEYGYSEEISFLEDYYIINSTPSLVIDYGDSVEGLMEKEDIESLMRE